MPPRWKVLVLYGDGRRPWWSYSGGEPNTRRQYDSTEVPPGGAVLLIRRGEDRRGWIEVERRECRTRMIRLADMHDPTAIVLEPEILPGWEDGPNGPGFYEVRERGRALPRVRGRVIADGRFVGPSGFPIPAPTGYLWRRLYP